jgi:hypothetical protein
MKREELKSLGITKLKEIARTLRDEGFDIFNFSSYKSSDKNKLIDKILTAIEEQKPSPKKPSPKKPSPKKPSPKKPSPEENEYYSEYENFYEEDVKRKKELSSLGITKLKEISKNMKNDGYDIYGYSGFKSGDKDKLVNKILEHYKIKSKRRILKRRSRRLSKLSRKLPSPKLPSPKLPSPKLPSPKLPSPKLPSPKIKEQKKKKYTRDELEDLTLTKLKKIGKDLKDNSYEMKGYTTLDRDSLIEKILKTKKIIKMVGDGNCFFASVLYHYNNLFNNDISEFRKALYEYMLHNRERYQNAVVGDYIKEITKIKKDKEWNFSTFDIVPAAVSDMLNCSIEIYNKDSGNLVQNIRKPNDCIIKVTYTGTHYDVIEFL